MKQSQKGILKKDQQHDMKKEIHWDEEGIQQYDLERGKKMKVNEPKTPYEKALIEGEVDEKIDLDHEIDLDLKEAEKNKEAWQQQHQQKLDIQELNQRLQKDLERERKDMDSDDEESEEKKKKHEEFLKKRKQHYNEKMRIQQALHQHFDEDEDK